MKKTLTRRRFSAAIAMLGAAMGASRRALADDIIPCQGTLEKKDWTAEWAVGSYTIRNAKPGRLDIIDKTQEIYMRGGGGILWRLQPEPDLLSMVVEHYYESNNYYLSIVGESGFDWRKVTNEPENVDERRLEERNLRTLLKREGLKDYDFERELSDDEIATYFSTTVKGPLIAELEVDGELYARREFDVEGLLVLMDAARNKGKQASETECCFITTSACSVIGLDDNCWELMTLRRYRDAYMLRNMSTRGDVEKYYKLAPAMVDTLHHHPNKKNIYLKLYWLYILPCALLAKCRFNRLTRKHYKKMFQWVQALCADKS